MPVKTRRKHSTGRAMGCAAAIALALSTLAPVTHAAWFAGHAQVPASSRFDQHAEQLAIEQALEDALYQAGASLSSLQQLHAGELVINRELLPTVEVQDLVIDQRDISNGQLSLSLRADVVPQAQYCTIESSAVPENYRHSVAVTRFAMSHPHQAAAGQLGELGDALAKRLYREVGLQQHGLIGRSYLSDVQWHAPTASSRGQLPWARAVGKQGDSQLVLGGEITDLHLSQDQTPGWKFWRKQPDRRSFALSLYLYDGITGDILNRRQYQFVTTWDKESERALPPSSSAFWLSPFGAKLDHLVRHMAVDLAADFRCQPLTGRVIGLRNGQVLINLGAQNGLQTGDQIQLSSIENWQLEDGQWRMVEHPPSQRLVVTQVNHQQALLAPDQAAWVLNLRQGDRVQVAK